MVLYLYNSALWCQTMMKLRWVPGSKSKLMQLDETLRSSIHNKNYGELVTVKHDGKSHDIWTVVVEGKHRDKVPVVMIHGVGGGSNMFLRNINFVARQRDVILLDLPGFGLSSRPNLDKKIDERGIEVETTEDDVEDFYIQVLEKWFDTMNLDQAILLGHSFGGYLSSVYCLSYPQRVKHLVLADPWGYGRPRTVTGTTFKQKALFFLVEKLYYKVNMFTPFRALGPLGPRAFRSVRGDLNNSYNMREDGDTTFLDYLYTCNTAGDPSGEVAFAKLSLPFAFARKPLVDRVQGWRPELDVTFICGKKSWMRFNSGGEIQQTRPDSYTDVQYVEEAGHHVHSDNPNVFNHILQQITKAVDEGVKPEIVR